MLTYPMSTGRNFDEILRALDSMQLTARFEVATPANWRTGEDVIIIPALSETSNPLRRIKKQDPVLKRTGSC